MRLYVCLLWSKPTKKRKGGTKKAKRERELELLSWCFEPSQPQRITLGLNTNFTLSPRNSFHKSSYYKSCFFIIFFFSLFIFRGHSTREPASSRVTYFILRAYAGTGVNHSYHRNTQKRFGKMQVNGPEG